MRAAPPANPAPTTDPGRGADGALQKALRLEQNGQLDEAVKELERAIGSSPDAAPLYNRLSIVLARDQGRFNKAEELLQKAIDLDPGNEVYRRNMLKLVAQQATRAAARGQ